MIGANGMVRIGTCAVACVTFGLAVFATGCGSKPAGNEKLATTAPVTGVVTYKGNPIKDAEVVFTPQGEGNPATGRTEENGRFVLTTYQERDGAAIGFHVVTVKVMPVGGLPGQEIESTGATDVPAKYSSTKTSPLTVEVKEGPNNLELKLED
jgi:hypothetical protein